MVNKTKFNAVLLSFCATLFSSSAISSDISFASKISEISQFYDEIRTIEANRFNFDDHTRRLELCDQAIKETKLLGYQNIGNYYKGFSDGSKKSEQMAFIKNHINCEEAIKRNKNVSNITMEDIQKKQKKLDEAVDLYRSGKETEIIFTKKNSD